MMKFIDNYLHITDMATKTISITKEACKRTNKRSIFEIVGILSKEEASKMEKGIKRVRSFSNKRNKSRNLLINSLVH